MIKPSKLTRERLEKRGIKPTDKQYLWHSIDEGLTKENLVDIMHYLVISNTISMSFLNKAKEIVRRK